jgi:hypothetical protein
MKRIVSQLLMLVPVLVLHGAASFTALIVFLLMSMYSMTSQANSAKTRALEDRMANMEGMVFPNTGGTINGSATTTGDVISQGDTFVGGNIYGNGGGALENQSGIHSAGQVVADGGIVSQGQALSIPQPRGSGLATAPSSYSQSWGNSVVSFCTQVNNSLENAGVFSP